jgi:membrane protease YdiL (CAAX protease family)
VPVPTRLLVTFLACAALLWAAPRARGLAPGAVGLALQALLSASLFVALAAGLAGVPAGPRGTAARRLGLGPGRVPRWSVALLCVGSLALSSALDAAIRMLELKGQGQLGAIERQLEGTRGPELAFALLAIAIGSALAEELFFRGLVQRALERGLARALPRAAGALAVTGGALAFAAAHGDRIHSPAALVLGLYFGTMTWLARSVRAAAVCHVVNNTAAVLGLALAADQTGSPEVRIAAGAAVAAAALALAFRAARAAGGTDPVAPGPPAPFSGGPDRPTGEP